MKLYSLSNMSTQKTDSHVNNLLSSCWSASTMNAGRSLCPPEQFILDDHKLLLDDHEIELESLPCDSDAEKSSVDVFDSLILNSQSLNTDLAELKPLPPFTGYTGHLSINGISGHHYHAIAHRHISNEENNNIYTTNLNSSAGGAAFAQQNSDQNIVSSSTCLPDSAMYPETTENISTSCYQDVKLFSDNGSIDSKMCSAMADSCAMTIPCPDSMSSVRIYTDSKELAEYVDMSSIEDIAAIIGSAIADTTVPNQNEEREGTDSRDSWMDLDAWIDGNCVQQDGKLIASQQESINEFILPNSPVLTSTEPPSSTLQNLLANNYMPLLQSRLQNGPPLKNEAPTSTSYCNDSITTTNSPPDSVVSTTDNLLPNGRCMSSSMNHHQQQPQLGNYQLNVTATAIDTDGNCSPDLLSKYTHAASAMASISSMQNTSKGKRRAPKSLKNNCNGSGGGGSSNGSGNGHMSNISLNNQMRSQNDSIGSSLNFQNANDLSDLLGKEKPVHRCNICNRGFLNKSNIKVHLRFVHFIYRMHSYGIFLVSHILFFSFILQDSHRRKAVSL